VIEDIGQEIVALEGKVGESSEFGEIGEMTSRLRSNCVCVDRHGMVWRITATFLSKFVRGFVNGIEYSVCGV
jgi:hypothetical protein